MKSDIDFKKYEPLIMKMAQKTLKKIPLNKRIFFEIDDLMQEGRLTFLKAVEAFDQERGCAFITYFFRTLQSCYFRILRNELSQHTLFINIDVCNERQNQLINKITPERELLIAEEINALPKEIASLIWDGIPDNMYRFIKNRMRFNQVKKGRLAINGIIRINKKIIKLFFSSGYNIKE